MFSCNGKNNAKTNQEDRMKISFFVPPSNCCPIEECHTACFMFGHPTIWGWLLLLAFILVLSIVMAWWRVTEK